MHHYFMFIRFFILCLFYKAEQQKKKKKSVLVPKNRNYVLAILNIYIINLHESKITKNSKCRRCSL